MKLSKHTQKYLIALAVLLTAGLSACDVLHDDLSGCDLYLKFRYDYNLDNEDRFAEQVEEVKIFVFDESGAFLGQFGESGGALKQDGYRMRIPYELKGCRAVVWAGKTDRFYSLPVLAVGDPMERLTLEYGPENDVSDKRLDPLWHAGPVTMEFPEDGGTVQTVSLVRNTNDVAVGLTRGDAPVGVSDFVIEITGANGAYDYKNAFAGNPRRITYRPCPETTTGETARLHTMRFVKGSDVSLAVRSVSSGRAIDIGGNTEIDLIEYLLKSKPDGMNDQEYLDRQYEWDVDIRLGDKSDNGYLALSITINGWTYWFHPIDM